MRLRLHRIVWMPQVLLLKISNCNENGNNESKLSDRSSIFSNGRPSCELFLSELYSWYSYLCGVKRWKKSEVVPVHVVKACGGCRSVNPLIFLMATRWRWVISAMPSPLYPLGKIPQYPLNGRLGGPQSQTRPGRGENVLMVLSLIPWPIQPLA